MGRQFLLGTILCQSPLNWAVRTKILIKILTLIAGLLTLSCNQSQESEILGQWQMNSIVYADGTVKNLGGENAVIFEESEIIEQIEGIGLRRYPYNREGDSFTLKSGNDEVHWKLIAHTNDALKIETPIGTYNLQK